MKTFAKITCGLLLATLPAISPSGRAADRENLVDAEKAKVNAPKSPLSVAQIQSATVKNPQGLVLGHVDRILADQKTGQIKLVLISVGGFLGIGDKLVAVPWSALSSAGLKGNLVLDASKGELETAPGVGSPNLTETSYNQWLEWSERYFGKNRRVRRAQEARAGKRAEEKKRETAETAKTRERAVTDEEARKRKAEKSAAREKARTEKELSEKEAAEKSEAEKKAAQAARGAKRKAQAEEQAVQKKAAAAKERAQDPTPAGSPPAGATTGTQE